MNEYSKMKEDAIIMAKLRQSQTTVNILNKAQLQSPCCLRWKPAEKFVRFNCVRVCSKWWNKLKRRAVIQLTLQNLEVNTLNYACQECYTRYYLLI